MENAKDIHNRNFFTGYPVKPNNGVDVNSTYTNNIIMLMNNNRDNNNFVLTMPDAVKDIVRYERDAENSVSCSHTIFFFPENFEDEKKQKEKDQPEKTKKVKQRTKSASNPYVPSWAEFTKKLLEEED